MDKIATINLDLWTFYAETKQKIETNASVGFFDCSENQTHIHNFVMKLMEKLNLVDFVYRVI